MHIGKGGTLLSCKPQEHSSKSSTNDTVGVILPIHVHVVLVLARFGLRLPRLRPRRNRLGLWTVCLLYTSRCV